MNGSMKMQKLMKILNSLKMNFLIFLLFFILAFPSLASVNKAEEQLSQGKVREAIDTLSVLAEKNHAHALYMLGYIYLSPNLRHLNPQKGIAFLERAVFHNYGPAIDELAGLYLSGDGVVKDEAKALHYYIQGSFLGYGPSQFNCGIMFKDGMGTEKDLPKAYFHLCLASLNLKDLSEVALDAARYRDEVAVQLTPAQRQDVLLHINAMTLPEKSQKKKTSANVGTAKSE